MRHEVKVTDDGSATLYVPAVNEHYHSTYGAVQESVHVFVQAGLMTLKEKKINILEVGFGTGLNALLTFLRSPASVQINYYGIEPDPLSWTLIRTLRYDDFLDLSEKQRKCFQLMHTSNWGCATEISGSFVLHKIRAGLNDLSFRDTFDLVYFDAFAPNVQPELWSGSVFQKLSDAMRNGGILVTYCSKGDVRRNMQKAGFKAERLPGPPGKREMLRAKKTANR
ncbi:MAG: tRNA (5-methylaminomethyl-2-thiouridine)(34)-methyltransferase MnmD [Bacteroidales bacterium]|jgi:tRNA U34 5-methylaminomethyl-2-thiouridine-forming methyltransferase MnmC